MRFSIIMPSCLTQYRNSASQLDLKIRRAIDSVLKQSFEDWELIVVSDGCLKTMEIVTPYVYDNLPRIRLLSVPKQNQWSGKVRNAGIFKSEGEIISYLDVDDYLGGDHLKTIHENFGNNEWVFFNDWAYNKKSGQWYERPARFSFGQCGTSNIAHKRSLEVYWMDNTYRHDFVLIKSLINASGHYSHIPTPSYFVCHIPNQYDI